LAPAANLMPSRDDIALALRAAHQSQREAEQQPAVAPVAVATAAPTATMPVAAAPVAAALVASAPVTAPPVRRLGADELATLIKRAKNLISIGDIAPARLLLERAADAQEPTAALLLAQTYDPAVLGVTDMRSITPDPAMARDWYEKAARLGSADARQRLTQMQN
jgi:TPR repeat protein